MLLRVGIANLVITNFYVLEIEHRRGRECCAQLDSADAVDVFF